MKNDILINSEYLKAQFETLDLYEKAIINHIQNILLELSTINSYELKFKGFANKKECQFEISKVRLLKQSAMNKKSIDLNQINFFNEN